MKVTREVLCVGCSGTGCLPGASENVSGHFKFPLFAVVLVNGPFASGVVADVCRMPWPRHESDSHSAGANDPADAVALHRLQGPRENRQAAGPVQDVQRQEDGRGTESVGGAH
jgi:hypothetical protein